MFISTILIYEKWPSWSWLYGSWIYNYLCNQWISPLTFGVRIALNWCVLETTLCDKVYQWLATGWCFFLVLRCHPPIKTNRHDIAEILFKVALNTITLTLHTREATQLYSCIILLDLFWFINYKLVYAIQQDSFIIWKIYKKNTI